jgi:hypothetical protein
MLREASWKILLFESSPFEFVVAALGEFAIGLLCQARRRADDILIHAATPDGTGGWPLRGQSRRLNPLNIGGL